MRYYLGLIAFLGAICGATISMGASQSPYDPGAARREICGSASGWECERLIQLQVACEQYRGIALGVFAAKQRGIPQEIEMRTVSSMAYGPGGIALRGSAETEDLLLRLVSAAYWGNGLYGKTAQEFARYAFDTCKREKPF